jgi:hypothetical protein
MGDMINGISWRIDVKTQSLWSIIGVSGLPSSLYLSVNSFIMNHLALPRIGA